MYQVTYSKLAIMKGGEIGNISQGRDWAYMDCDISEIMKLLQNNLKSEQRDKKYYPVIENIKKINGHIVNHIADIGKMVL